MVGFIYRHPSTELGEFGSVYLTNLLEKLSLENKALVLLGDFHANLLKYDIDTNISNFIAIITTALLTTLVILSSHCLTIMHNS